MTDYPAENNGSSAGATLTERSGAAISIDTVPAGCKILARNTGAGTHTLVLPVGSLYDGLAVANRSHSLAAGAIRGFAVPAGYGDANGRVNMYVGEGTQSEVKYYVLGS